MNTPLLQKIFLCAALAITLQSAQAQTDTTYIGPNNGLYSNPANWSNGVPINNTFHAINNTDFIIQLDIDPTINSLTLGADIGRLFGTDHNFTVTGSTSMGTGNRIDVVAQSLPNVKFDLGSLTSFSGTTLNFGGYFVTAAPGTTSKLQFNGANIVTNNARIGIIGAGAAIVDQNGVNALANLTTNGVDGFIRIGSGASFTTANNFTNGGYMVARPGGTYTFNGSFACVTNPANPDAGLFEVFGTDLGPAASQGDGLLAANGSFGDVNAAGDTLVDGQLTTVSNGSATAMIRFNNANIININNAAAVTLAGPNSRIVDQSGNDGLRNLATNDGYVELARQARSTIGSFTNNGVVVLLGGGNPTVGGSMTNNGVFGVLALDLFLFVGVPGFDPAPDGAIPTLVTINGNLTLGSTSDYFAEVYDPTITGSVRVNGIAALDGVLELLLIDPSLITSTDTFTLILTDGQITGAFTNVLSGGRLDATQDTDASGTGDVVGSFRVDYDGNSLTITDFQVVPQLIGAVSRKTHGSAGTFDIDLPLDGDPGVECRKGNPTIVFTFTNNIVTGEASLTKGTGSVAGSPVISGNTMRVNLTGITDAETVTITLSKVSDQYAHVLPDIPLNITFLLGDTNGNGAVNSSDVSQIKAQVGHSVNSENFRTDLNSNGAINAGDVAIVKSRSGHGLP